MKSLILGLALALFACPTLVVAQQDETPPVQIIETRPASVWVQPGGKADVLRLYGRGFELVRKVEVRRSGARAAGLEAKIRNVSQGIAELEVQADGTALPGKDYQVVFFTHNASFPMEQLEFEVVGPEE